jgi:hypothetical protein
MQVEDITSKRKYTQHVQPIMKFLEERSLMAGNNGNKSGFQKSIDGAMRRMTMKPQPGKKKNTVHPEVFKTSILDRNE